MNICFKQLRMVWSLAVQEHNVGMTVCYCGIVD